MLQEMPYNASLPEAVQYAFMHPGIYISSIGVAILALGIYFVYVQPLRHSIQTSEAIQALTLTYEQHPLHPDRYILVAGDSTAVGTGASNPKLSIAGRLGSEYPNADITNVSKYGLRLSGLREMLRTLPREQYDLVVLQIGANDVTGRTSEAAMRQSLSEILIRVESLSPRVVVLTAGNIGLAPVFRFPLSTFITARTRAARILFMDELRKYPQARYVDLFKDRAHETFTTDVKRYYAPDGFHPSADGYGLWYLEVKKQIDDLYL